MPRREPLLPQGRADALRRRIAGLVSRRATSTPVTPAVSEGSFLRRSLDAPRRLRGARILAVLGVVWMLTTLLVGDHGLLTIAELRSERDRLREEARALEAEIHALETRLAESTGDPHRLERTARETYGLARPGETVYRLRPIDERVDEPGPIDRPG